MSTAKRQLEVVMKDGIFLVKKEDGKYFTLADGRVIRRLDKRILQVRKRG